MLWFIILAISSFLCMTTAKPKYCRCWEGYRIDISNNGPQCVAINQFHIMPCNMVKAPKCQCSGRVSSILKDQTGTWCTTYKKGHEFMRWPCENIKEWDDFFRKHPDFI